MFDFSLKSVMLLQVRLYLRNCDLITPEKVCFGWWDDLCIRAWVSVGLKKVFVSKMPCCWNLGPLNMVRSKKSIVSGLCSYLSLIDGWMLFIVSIVVVISSMGWSKIMRMSSKYLR